MADGRSTGAFMFVILIVYFVFFIFIVSAVADIQNGTGANTTLVPGKSGINSLAIYETCNSPRYKYNPTDFSKEEYKQVGLNNLACEDSKGVFSQDACESIQGCDWVNTTTGSYLWGLSCIWTSCTSIEACEGDINGTYYGIQVTDPLVGRDYMTQHNNTGALAGFIQEYTPVSGASNNICLHPNVVYNESLCSLFSCSWDRPEFEISSAGDVLGLAGDLFTFDYDFEFESEFANTLMYFIFIVIPFICLIFAIYLLVR